MYHGLVDDEDNDISIGEVDDDDRYPAAVIEGGGTMEEVVGAVVASMDRY